jgi:phosphopentomutase/2,3-bisphosphoglycerate-independent phosphoglycerate mutase family metalloenzyme
MGRLLLLSTVVAGIIAGCGTTAGDVRLPRPHPAPAQTSRHTPALVLVTIDGARATDVFDAATMPNLARLIARGVALGGAEAPMVASGPRFVSLPGYREILTGRRGSGCLDNECPLIDEPTLLDELRRSDAPDAGDVAVIASWDVITRAASIAPSTVALSAGRHGGATRAALAVSDAARADLAASARASAWPGHGDYRPDALTARLALDVIAARQPRVLWIALGDSDEFAHRDDRQGYRRALAAADALLGRLTAAVALDDTLLFVTADHGRAANFRDHGDAPESSAVWLVAAGGSIPRLGFARTHELHRLADIAPTLRALLDLGADDSARAGREIPELVAKSAAILSLR